MNTRDKLTKLLQAGYSGIAIPSHEPQRVEAEVAAAAKTAGFTFYVWTCTKGMFRIVLDGDKSSAEKVAPPKREDEGIPPPPHYECLDIFDAIKGKEKAVVLLHGYGMFMTNPDAFLYQRIKDSLLRGKLCNHALVISGATLTLPAELEKEFAVVDFTLPDRKAILTVVENICKSANVELNGGTEQVIDACSGGTTTEIENWLSLAVIEGKGKEINHRVIELEKASTLKKSGILEVVTTGITFKDLGGLEELKTWISRRKRAFTKEADEYHLPRPKGVCLYGVSGCGKSFATNAIANELEVPHLRMDAGKLFNQYIGQSEAAIRAVIAQVEAFGKCVLQIEELDKSFAGMKSSHDGDSGVTRRVIGTFLTWMQEKTSPVFIVATANDMTKLPPELLRKGRWDDLWFFDLPTLPERIEIWKIRIRLGHRKAGDFDLKALAKATNGWTGAEIEALFNEALYVAFDEGKEPDTKLLVKLADATSPMSVMMEAETEALRRWSRGKARMASKVA